MMKRLIDTLVVTLFLIGSSSMLQAKECSRFVTAQMRQNAVENVNKFDWVASEQESAIAAAEQWISLSDDELWAMIPSQELPRDSNTNKEAGCPNCGDEIIPYGDNPWTIDFWDAPWKIKCPNCGQVYPKNDFYAFYKTALDEHGFFRRELGDRSLLFNAEHPDPNDPLHKLYVDDGYGMIDEKGLRHRAVAYYVQRHWRAIYYEALAALPRAYTLTNDARYAHKAAVLLDRIADVYPDMDYWPLARLGFEGSGRRGRIFGRIAECDVGRSMAYAYDKIYDGTQGDEELVKFCSQRAKQYRLGDKSTIAEICRNIEDNLILEILKSTKDGRIWGNTGKHQTTLAVAAIALDREEVTEQWLDWLFEPGFPGSFPPWPGASREVRKDPIPWVLVDGLDRNGMGGECGGYGLGWSSKMKDMAKILASYPDYTNHNMLTEFPTLKQSFFIEPRLLCLDSAFPHIGDCGVAGAWGGQWQSAPYKYEIRPWAFTRGYKLYHDPRMAALAWRYAGQKIENLRDPYDGSIFEKDPDALGSEIAQVARLEPFKLKCEHLGRYGLAVLQTEQQEDGRALWIHYGYRLGHSHRDALNIGLFAKNLEMLQEMGYPEHTGGWPKRFAWTSNTISHNTLQVNDNWSVSAGGKINQFAIQPPVRLIDVPAPNAYPDMETYR